MSLARLRVVASDEFRLTFKRPMIWILIVLLAFLSYGISVGWVQVVIASGDATVGGKKAFLTSEFAITQMMAAFTWSAFIFFAAAAAGLSITRDDEARVLEVLQSTPLRPGEYAWGKFLGVFGAFLTLLALTVVFLMLSLSVLPNAEMIETRGPFVLSNYLKPALLFGVPNLLFMTGMSFAIGTAFRRPILVFAFPVALFLICGLFLWSWSPTWLTDRANAMLMFADPSGLRWLTETWLKVDRGVQFYNTQSVGVDGVLLGSRITWSVLSIGSVLLAVRRFTRTARASHVVAPDVVSRALSAPEVAVATPSSHVALPASQVRAQSWWHTVRLIAGAEARELRSQPGLYLFVPLVLLQVIATSVLAVGAFDTPLLRTPGQLAVSQMELLTAYVTLLLVFYAVESLERERSTRLNAIHDALPVSTGALLGGKALALGVVIGVIMLTCLLAAAAMVVIQGTVPYSITPFALLWVLLLLPTFFAVIAFVFMAYGIARGRYGAYGLSLGAIGLGVWAALTDHENWVSDWSLTSAIRWSDMSVLEWDRPALILNRLLWLAIGALCWRAAVKLYPRVEKDPIRWLQGGSMRRRWRALRPALPLIVVTVVLAALTWRQVNKGPDGSRAEKVQKDYWRKNLATWWNARLPWVKDADVRVRLEPQERAFDISGSYLIVNHRDTVLRKIPLTVGMWDDMRFTVNGDSIRPDTASHLYVFTLPTALNPGDSARLGFAYRGRAQGASRAGGGAGEFIVPAGAVMQGWSPEFFPNVGYIASIGQDEDNSYESREYPEDFWTGVTPALFGSELPMTTRTVIDVPEAYRGNGVGELVREEVKDGRRVTEFRSDVPVMAYNVVAGRWNVKKGDGTQLYFHPAHTYNVDEMLDAMNHAKTWYGTWFGEYPWRELKISEFPNLASYAQGFPTNITFSEGIGFLTKSEPRTNLAFLVTAHEIAHQWWGNMLQPGRGPGSNLLSEGLAHFSTALLIEQVKGVRNGIEFRKRIETQYGNGRFADAERKLYRIDGTRQGDGTVTYDKGGWVFWMLADLMGRESATRGLKEFIAAYRGNPDHPVLQDFTRHMRGYAADTSAYDTFVRQWFDSVMVVEYKVDSASTSKRADGKWETRADVRNVGTAIMPVDVSVTRGDRFPEDTTKAAAKPYLQAITRVEVRPDGKRMVVTVVSDFEPEKVVVDPDVRVLQLRRSQAERKVGG